MTTPTVDLRDCPINLHRVVESALLQYDGSDCIIRGGYDVRFEGDTVRVTMMRKPYIIETIWQGKVEEAS